MCVLIVLKGATFANLDLESISMRLIAREPIQQKQAIKYAGLKSP